MYYCNLIDKNNGYTGFVVGFYEAIYQKRKHSYTYINCIIYLTFWYHK